MNRRLTASLAALVVPATVLIGGVSSPAEAGTPGCITKPEYNKLKHGFPIKKVRTIVGAQGKVESTYNAGGGFKTKSLSFRQCGSYGTAFIDFQSTEKDVYKPDVYCYDMDGDGYEEDCEDYGYWTTKYVSPLRQSAKYAFWG